MVVSRFVALSVSLTWKVSLLQPGHCPVLELAYPELGLIAECPGTTCWPPLDVSKNSTLDFISTICKLRGF